MKDPRFTGTILRWYAENGRDLPWRRTHDPYAIWLSEIILQQTRIAQGQAYWERFLEKWPDVESLAAASEDEVLRVWAGLGYYSRARHLLAAARQIAAAGRFPDTLEGIRALKGVGDYTAAAIASIGFGIPVAAVDGNVYRVLARYFGVATPVGSTAAKKAFTALADALVPAEAPGDFNQALMDFGSLQCTPGQPDCLQCPLADTCTAFRTGRVALLPVKKPPVTVKTRYFTYIYLCCQGSVALHRRASGDIWQGLWEPLLFEFEAPGAVDALPAWIERSALQLVRKGVKHQLTHRTLLADFYRLETQTRPPLPEGYIWIEETQIDQYAKPRLVEILLDSQRKLLSLL